MRNSGLADMDPSAMMGAAGGRGGRGAGRGRGRGMPNMRQVFLLIQFTLSCPSVC
jgi:hypothetical protein